MSVPSPQPRETFEVLTTRGPGASNVMWWLDRTGRGRKTVAEGVAPTHGEALRAAAAALDRAEVSS